MLTFDIKEVIDNDYCIGCGTCVAIAPETFEAYLDFKTGQIKAKYKTQSNHQDWANADQVCPFSSASLNEDEIADIYKYDGIKYNERIGHYQSIYVSRVSDSTIYKKASSGGIIRWLLQKLLNEGKVSSVICVMPGEGRSLFKYAILNSVDDIINSATSSYYPVEWSEILSIIEKTDKPIAITGLPCFIKALKNYIRAKGLNPSLFITVGLICGHLKSTFYAFMLAEQLNIRPSDLRSINFRKKMPNTLANNKGVAVRSTLDTSKEEVVTTVKQLFGTDYGFGLFKYKACDFCDDVFAETADVVVGDAWIPKYLNQGNSLLVTRSNLVDALIKKYTQKGELITDRITIDEAIASQDAGLRHRKDTISYRLYLEKKKKKWVPLKRSYSHNHFSIRTKLIQRLRILAREKSTEYYYHNLQAPNFRRFKAKVNYLFGIYKSLYGKVWLRPLKLLLALLNLY
ncbi:MAG: coenzyme F420 hydrogenase [Verrucomicrobiales bacterium]|nr:coenzyme F420 hydrogenase [Verrucomicrobiales bacterium]|tara:strand:+ start:528 stop:1901 length:1374 start_codon:yes stop_codon:yes gene_type:complete